MSLASVWLNVSHVLVFPKFGVGPKAEMYSGMADVYVDSWKDFIAFTDSGELLFRACFGELPKESDISYEIIPNGSSSISSLDRKS